MEEDMQNDRNEAAMEKLLVRVRLLERQMTYCFQNHKQVLGKCKSLEEQVGEMDGRLEEVESELWSGHNKHGADGGEIELPSTNLRNPEPAHAVSEIEYDDPLGAAIDLDGVEEPETKPYECKFCPGGDTQVQVLFDNTAGLASHYSTHHSTNNCTESLAKAKATTTTHKSEEGKGESRFLCPKCPKSFAQHHTMKRHLRTMHSVPGFKCPDEGCGRIFRRKDNLNTHQLQTHAPTQQGTSFAVAIASGITVPAKARKRLHPLEPLEARTCPECGKVYGKRHHMRRHVTAAHSDVKFDCKDCGRLFSRRDRLKEHRDRLHGALGAPKATRRDFQQEENKSSKGKAETRPEKPSPVPKAPPAMPREGEAPPDPEGSRTCPVCTKIFQSRNHMVRHRNSVHSEPTFTCEFCGKTFRRKDKVRDHQQRVHRQVSDALKARKKRRRPEEEDHDQDQATEEGKTGAHREEEEEEHPGGAFFMDLELVGS